MSVLLVENYPGLQRAYSRVLNAMGLGVTSIMKIKEVVPGTNKVIARTPDGDDWVEVNLDAGFRVALLDFDLGEDSLKGHAVVKMLRALGVFCLCIGDGEGGQIKMIWEGANLAVRLKVTVGDAIAGRLACEGYRWPEDFDVEKDGAAVLEQLRQLLTAAG